MKYIIKWDIDTDGDFGFADYYNRDRKIYGYDGDENYSGVVCFDDVCKAREFLRTMLSDLHVTSSHYWLLRDIYEKFEALISFCNEGRRGRHDEEFDGNADGYISVCMIEEKEENHKEHEEEYKDYYVSYRGSTIVSARDEDEACEIAMNEMSIEEINAYEMKEDGNGDFIRLI